MNGCNLHILCLFSLLVLFAAVFWRAKDVYRLQSKAYAYRPIPAYMKYSLSVKGYGFGLSETPRNGKMPRKRSQGIRFNFVLI